MAHVLSFSQYYGQFPGKLGQCNNKQNVHVIADYWQVMVNHAQVQMIWNTYFHEFLIYESLVMYENNELNWTCLFAFGIILYWLQ